MYNTRKLTRKFLSFYVIKYEFLNTLYNGYAFFFGAIFPIALLHLVLIGVLKDVPKFLEDDITTSLFLGFAMIIPLAAIFLSHASSFANELEKDVPQRLVLFGFSQSGILYAKLAANFIFLVFCVIVYVIGTVPFLKIATPTLSALLIFIILFFFMSALLLALAHGIANIFKKMGPTYGVAMGLYFGIMIFSGYMGIQVKDLPTWAQKISEFMPTRQLGMDYLNFWLGKDFSFKPLILSFIVFGSICLLILFLSFRKTARIKTKVPIHIKKKQGI